VSFDDGDNGLLWPIFRRRSTTELPQGVLLCACEFEAPLYVGIIHVDISQYKSEARPLHYPPRRDIAPCRCICSVSASHPPQRRHTVGSNNTTAAGCAIDQGRLCSHSVFFLLIHRGRTDHSLTTRGRTGQRVAKDCRRRRFVEQQWRHTADGVVSGPNLYILIYIHREREVCVCVCDVALDIFVSLSFLTSQKFSGPKGQRCEVELMKQRRPSANY